MSSLTSHLDSTYIAAANRLEGRGAALRIVAYVESYDDIFFWNQLLGEVEDEVNEAGGRRLHFEVLLPSRNSLCRGKKMALSNRLGPQMIACVDADYDYLEQGATPVSHEVCSSPYVLHTIVYAIENYQCYAEGLHDVCVQATLNDRPSLDFPALLRRYSEIVYPLFLWNIWFYRNHDTHSFSMGDFNSVTRLLEVSVARPERALDDLAARVTKRLNTLRNRHHALRRAVEALGQQLLTLGLKPQNCYLFIQGHHLMDNVVMKLLTPVCTQLRREREQEIKRLSRHEEQFRNELTGYENCLASPELILRKSDNYREMELYQRLRSDLEHLFK